MMCASAGAPGGARGGMTMWKTIGMLTALCAVFEALLITLSIVGLKI
jgi:hypothetical protein